MHDLVTLAYWQGFLELEDFHIKLERIRTWQVCNGAHKIGQSFVGVHADRKSKEAIIHHTRRLTDEDIVHELLHVKHPKWSESKVNLETQRLLEKVKSG